MVPKLRAWLHYTSFRATRGLTRTLRRLTQKESGIKSVFVRVRPRVVCEVGEVHGA